ncbi:hypothetical protein [Fimbriimonas ginsengisoli]|uniref:Uncharacterized protein n=1 Tax=Fimbriimonas ginsengisoli Gsoil 348 TaxID=661478 RepID=A0A068NYY2_FIMGI|nr:hypothetical protein [Fimbriimonas ginsengisoli]AIE87619.1 hypothetical protein OP10G_4251 [Fimbriimonas ginsengisoli Gsoil 348]
MEIVAFSGWERNARLVCNDVEMIVTLEVGPRVISYGPVGGPNLFFVNPDDAGKKRGDKFRGYGGHRLWIAPEEELRTFRPDNDPVEVTEEDGFYVFTSPPDEYHTQKEIRIRPEPENDRFVLMHRIYNHSGYPLEFAAWAPTQCSGGVVLFPQAPFVPHSEDVLPGRPLVMWRYTRLGDPRWTWGDQVARLRHDPNLGPTKIGSLVEQGYAACVNEGHVFLKRFGCDPDASYPDFECNFETFTRQDMLEIESLGPMEFVYPGEFAEHQETWYLIPNQTVPEDDYECAKWLEGLAEGRKL